jgi:hypothetical protein
VPNPGGREAHSRTAPTATGSDAGHIIAPEPVRAQRGHRRGQQRYRIPGSGRGWPSRAPPGTAQNRQGLHGSPAVPSHFVTNIRRALMHASRRYARAAGASHRRSRLRMSVGLRRGWRRRLPARPSASLCSQQCSQAPDGCGPTCTATVVASSAHAPWPAPLRKLVNGGPGTNRRARCMPDRAVKRRRSRALTDTRSGR